MFYQLGLQTTNLCPFACMHCGADSGKGKRSADFSLLQDISKRLNETDIKEVAITGGEPLVDMVDVCKLVSTIASSGLQTKLVTNGFWGKGASRALEIIKILKDTGLNTIVLSVDVFHMEYMSYETYYNIASALNKIWDGNIVVFGLIGLERSEQLKKIYHLFKGGNFFFQRLLPVGRARNLPKNYFSTLASDKIDIPCTQILSPFLSCEHVLYKCSNAATINERHCLAAGKVLSGADFVAKLETLKNDLFLKTMAVAGPSEVYRSYFSNKLNYISLCDFCLEMIREDLCGKKIESFYKSNRFDIDDIWEKYEEIVAP